MATSSLLTVQTKARPEVIYGTRRSCFWCNSIFEDTYRTISTSHHVDWLNLRSQAGPSPSPAKPTVRAVVNQHRYINSQAMSGLSGNFQSPRSLCCSLLPARCNQQIQAPRGVCAATTLASDNNGSDPWFKDNQCSANQHQNI